MNKFNENQRKFVTWMGIIVIVGAAAVIGLSIMNGGGFPIVASLLVIIGLTAIFLGNRK